MAIAFPGESAEYRAARDRLLEQEIELRRAMEAVAVARRSCRLAGLCRRIMSSRGKGQVVTRPKCGCRSCSSWQRLARDLQHDVPRDPDDERPGPQGGQTALLPLAEGPCPSCTALLDQLDGAAEHVSQRVNLAVAGKAPIERILALARERGWRRLRLLSSAGNSYNRDYFAETAEGTSSPC